MQRFSIVPPARVAALLGALVGIAAGVATTGIAVGAVGAVGDAATGSEGRERVTLEAAHLPPLLRLRGEDVRLSFDAFCVPAESSVETDDESAGCDVTGSVFARAGRRGAFIELPLTHADAAAPNHLLVDVPEALTSWPTGFSYYAVLRADGAAALTLPGGGAGAPLVSVPLERPVEVALGRHVFGGSRQPDERVASAAWGAGPLEVGLEPGRRATPIGASAFAVDRIGGVYLLDEAKHRLLHWSRRPRVVSSIPIAVSGTLADMTVARDGTIYVLETVGRPGRTPLVRRFDVDGRELEAIETAERTASEIAPGPSGPFVLQQPANQWMPVVVDGVPADARAQLDGARLGHPLPTGGEVTVLRRGNEILVDLVDGRGARRSWDVTSATDLAEIQLAEPLGARLVLVARVYSSSKDEFLCLVLDAHGLVRSFSLDSADWAETAPLGRFELVGSSLYRLGSTPAEAFVDRYDLEVR